MAQSYNTLTTATIFTVVDEILGFTSRLQILGSSLSRRSPSGTIVTATNDSLTVLLDNDGGGGQTITLAAQTDNLFAIATDIQTKVRALTAVGPATQAAFDNFICRYDTSLDQIVCLSGTAGAATSACVMTGTAASGPLKLGATGGGTESATGSEVITYTFKYRFNLNAGGGEEYGGATVVVESTEMTTATDTAEARTLANAKATQIKAQLGDNDPFTTTESTALNGPVTL